MPALRQNSIEMSSRWQCSSRSFRPVVFRFDRDRDDSHHEAQQQVCVVIATLDYKNIFNVL